MSNDCVCGHEASHHLNNSYGCTDECNCVGYLDGKNGYGAELASLRNVTDELADWRQVHNTTNWPCEIAYDGEGDTCLSGNPRWLEGDWCVPCTVRKYTDDLPTPTPPTTRSQG